MLRILAPAIMASTIWSTVAFAAPNDALPEAPGKAVVVRACTSCHQAPMVVAKRRTADQWDEVIGKMIDRGARMTEAEQDQVYDYLVRYFGPVDAKPAAGK